MAGEIVGRMTAESGELFAPGRERKSDFFRDLAGSRFLALAEETSRREKTGFDRLVGPLRSRDPRGRESAGRAPTSSRAWCATRSPR